MQVHSWDRLSTGGSADRHCTSSHDTVGADCQREATPAGAGWFAVVESRRKCAKVKAVDVMHASSPGIAIEWRQW